MADSSALPSSAPRSRVVRSLARAAERPCARPGCPAPARATLTFSYATAEVHLDRLAEQVDPQGYDLCARHAARTEAPRGWGLTDRRPREDRVDAEPPPPPVRDLGSEATVAVLAAALRAVPEPPLPAVATDPVPPVTTPTTDPGPPVAAAVPDRVATDRGRARHDTRDDTTVELPRVAVPRPVPAAGDRGPAIDW